MGGLTQEEWDELSDMDRERLSRRLKVYANMHSVGPVYSSSGTSGFHSLQVAGTAVATQGDIVALAIALG